MLPGNIILIPFPFTDLSSSKVRPVLVLHVSKGENIICCFLSSQQKKMLHGVSVPISATNGLRVPSNIMCDKIATLDKGMALGALGTLERKIFALVKKEIKDIFDL